jgi:hypothetical protein
MEPWSLDVPELKAQSAGPHIIVKIDSIEFELVGLPYNDVIQHKLAWFYNIDDTWIKSVAVTKDSEGLEKYGYQNENGMTIGLATITIRLKKEYIDDFLDGKKVDNPMKIMRIK